MPIESGTLLGSYTIVAKLGAGGMGEVYRARDSKLKREVALKVLPADVASDRERLARFQREAEVLAALNHPNIAHIHGLEASNGTTALVMELVEGEDLAQRLARGPIPEDEALAIAKQIAEALEAAHEQGIIHRDLKPANIKVRDDGTVKVLDFGLAKALDQGLTASAPHSLENSPTITSPAMTMRGVILGTAAYMSPEQAKSKPVDRRTDIWAFGCVLYEMLAGARAFEGEDVTDTIAAVLTKEPDWSRLPGATSAGIRRLVARCLAKDRRHRLRDIGDARFDLDDVTAATDAATPSLTPRSRWRWLTFAAVVGLSVAGGWMAANYAAGPAAPTEPLRFQVSGPVAMPFSGRATAVLAVSPDGRQLVYVGQPGGSQRQLYLHTFATGTSRGLDNTLGVNAVFWSPDSRWLAYESQGRLQRLEISSGTTATICECRPTMRGSWNSDNVILYGDRVIHRVAANGGLPEAVTELDETRGETRHERPVFLPDGRHFLYVAVNTNATLTTLHYAELGSSTSKALGNIESGADYVAPGLLVYAQDSRLFARPFDDAAGEWRGEPLVISETVRQQGSGTASFSASPGGVVAFDATPIFGQEIELAWVSRTGQFLSEFAAVSGGHAFALSTNDAVAALEQVGSIWLLDGARGTRTRLTFEKDIQGHPAWSPDGMQVAYFNGTPGSTTQLFMKSASGTREPEPVLRGSDLPTTTKQVTDWSRDGRFIVFEEMNHGTGWDLKYVDLTGHRQPAPVVATPFHERQGQLSGNGRFIAYESNESGSTQVYVASFPDLASRWTISSNGGSKPRWNATSTELTYVDAAGVLHSVPTSVTGTFSVGVATALFELGAVETDGFNYAMARDGSRFLVMRPMRNAPPPRLSVIVNWPASLNRP